MDGDPGEWTAADRFAEMSDAGLRKLPVRATLSIRYDCTHNVLYAYVRAVGDGTVLRDRPENAYLRIDSRGKLVSGLSGDNGKAPDFAWVRSASKTRGWEASGRLAPGRYLVRAHVLLAWDDADGYLPLDIAPREVPLVLRCAAPPKASPSPKPTARPKPSEAPSARPTDTPSPKPSKDRDGDDHDDDTGSDEDVEGGIILVVPLLAGTVAWTTRPQRLRRRTRPR